MQGTMRTTPILLALVVAAACADPVHPDHAATNPGGGGIRPSIVTANGVASTITIDGTQAVINTGSNWSAGGTHVGLQFPVNPHRGDAIVATWTWRGTRNTITTVTDHLEDGTPVGNTYTLVDYATANGWSVAT